MRDSINVSALLENENKSTLSVNGLVPMNWTHSFPSLLQYPERETLESEQNGNGSLEQEGKGKHPVDCIFRYG